MKGVEIVFCLGKERDEFQSAIIWGKRALTCLSTPGKSSKVEFRSFSTPRKIPLSETISVIFSEGCVVCEIFTDKRTVIKKIVHFTNCQNNESYNS